MTKSTHNPYFPQLTPEREVIRLIHDTIAAQRGTCAITRGPSEQFILTCSCGVLQVTSDTTAPAKFSKEHEVCQ